MGQGFVRDYIVKATGETDVFVNGTKQDATSGTEIDFTIPSGVKAVKLLFSELSTNGVDALVIKVGDSGGIESSGYVGSVNYITTAVNGFAHSSYFLLNTASVAADLYSGEYTLSLLDSATNLWVVNGGMGATVYANFLCYGSKSLSGELTTIRLTTAAGTDTFDAGSVNVQYDNPSLSVSPITPVGGVVQTVHTQDGALSAAGTTLTPIDNTIPQVTEGTQFLSASITPTQTTNKLKVEVLMHLSNTTALEWITSHLHLDGGANAVASSTILHDNATRIFPHLITYWMIAGSTSSLTFTARAGGNLAGSTYMNGAGSAAEMGGTMYSSITITEYKV